MINLYLMRHGKTVGRPALNGKTDVLVEAHRQEQIAHTLLRSPYSFSNIITSPLRRCRDLAQQLVYSSRNWITKLSLISKRWILVTSMAWPLMNCNRCGQ